MCSSDLIAEWVDSDLSESLADTMRYRSARVFGVWSGVTGFERELIDSDADPYRLLTRLPSWRPVAGLCVVMTGWMSRVDEGDDDTGSDADRRRVRVTAAVNDEGVSVVVRRFDDDGCSDSFADGGEGIFPEALRVWWSAFVSLGTQREDR